MEEDYREDELAYMRVVVDLLSSVDYEEPILADCTFKKQHRTPIPIRKSLINKGRRSLNIETNTNETSDVNDNNTQNIPEDGRNNTLSEEGSGQGSGDGAEDDGNDNSTMYTVQEYNITTNSPENTTTKPKITTKITVWPSTKVPNSIREANACSVSHPSNLSLLFYLDILKVINPFVDYAGKSPVGLIIGVVIGSLFIILAVSCGICIFINKRQKAKNEKFRLKITQLELEKETRYTDFPKKYVLILPFLKIHIGSISGRSREETWLFTTTRN